MVVKEITIPAQTPSQKVYRAPKQTRPTGQKPSGRRSYRRPTSDRTPPDRRAPYHRPPENPPPDKRGSASHRRRPPRRKGPKRLPLLLLVGVAALVVGAFLLLWNHGGGLMALGKEQDAFVVMIDPGHGGVDKGAEGLNMQEYEMTWRTAQELMNLLEQDKRFTPVLSITESESQDPDMPRVTPTQRAERARERGADLMFSIHGNSAFSQDIRGFECYPIPPGREHHQKSMDLAFLLGEQFASAGASLRGTSGVRYIYYDALDNKRVVEISDNSVQTDLSFTVLEDSGCPAVLVEQCFITNYEDIAMFASEEGCKQSARLYYNAICAWYENQANSQQTT